MEGMYAKESYPLELRIPYMYFKFMVNIRVMS